MAEQNYNLVAQIIAEKQRQIEQLLHEITAYENATGWREICVNDLQLSTRTTNALLRAQIRSLADLALLWSTTDILKSVPGIGQTSITEITDVLRRYTTQELSN